MMGKDVPNVDAMPQTSARDGRASVARSVGEVEVLLLLLTTLYYFVVQDAIASSINWFACVAIFGFLILGIRTLPALRPQSRLRLGLEASAMVLLISGLISQAGDASGPLAHLYLLPVVSTAMVLGRGATVLQLALILAARLAIGVADGGLAWLSLRELGALFAELAPTLLVAFLTSALAKELNRATSYIRSNAELDDLTGLLNLRAFSRLASDEQRCAEQQGVPCAILMVDVEQLHEINDRFGHEAGDRALVAVATGLRRATRATDLCARYGGDECVVLLTGCGRESAEIMANRIRHHVFSATQDFDYAMRRLSVNIGVAVFPEDGRDVRTLLRAANRGMHRDKRARHARAVGLTARSGEIAP